MSKTTMAVVGLGHAANDFHLPCLTKFEDVELVLCDAWEERLRTACRKWDVAEERAYRDLDVMLATADLDAVYLLLPQYTKNGCAPVPFKDQAIRVLAARKPLFVEKPLGANAQEAREIVAAARSNDVVTTQCGFQRRFNPLLRDGLRRVRKRGPLLNCAFSFYKGKTLNNEEESIIADFDWLTYDMIHCLDLLRAVPEGEMVSFQSSVGTAPGDQVLTAFHALAQFSTGVTSVFMSNVRAGARILQFELHGVGISVFVRTDPGGAHRASMISTIFTNDNGDSPEIVCDYEVAHDPSFQACSGFWDENRHFVDRVNAGKSTDCAFEDALQTMELCERVIE